MDQFLPIIGVIAIFFIFMVLPQMTQRRQHKRELAAIKAGDWVVSIGGIIGQVLSISASEVRLRISRDGEITLVRQAIRSRIPPRQPFAPAATTEETTEETTDEHR